MLEWLYSWKTWLAVAIVVIILIWLMCHLQWRSTPVEKKQVKRTRSSREYVVSHEELSRLSCAESTLSESSSFSESAFSASAMEASVSLARPLDKRWQPEIPEEITNPVRPESMRKMAAKETKGGRLCKEAAEKIYGVTFHRSVWPDWLRNPETGRAMELDLYNEKLKLAIEYHGEQHYRYIPFFHKNSRKNFEAQVRRDNYKLDICDEHGVYVIVVPYNLPEEKIEEWIRYYDPTAYALRQARERQLQA